MDSLLGFVSLFAIVLFVCSLLAKIRQKEVMKVKPEQAKRGMIASVVLFFIVGLVGGPPPETSPEPASLGTAHQYTVIDDADVSFPGRTRLNRFISAPAALSKEDRAETVMQAAKDLQAQKDADLVTIYLEVGLFAKGQGRSLAMATYIPDGCGNSGDDCDGVEWKVSASDYQLTEQELAIWKGWREHREQFIEDGLVNESRLIAFLADQMNISEDQIDLPWIEQVQML